MSIEQAIAYVNSLNLLYVNKVISLGEFRSAMRNVQFYEEVCQEENAPKGK